MAKKEKLTKEEEAALVQAREEWFKWGTCTDPADREQAESAITELYQLAGHSAPRFIWVDGPMSAVKLIERERGGEAALQQCYWGQHESDWVAFYLFPKEHLGVEYDEGPAAQLELWAKIARSCLWWWPYEKVCVVSERLAEVHMEDGVLHRDGGPAVLCRDGHCVYALHGVRVPKWLAVEHDGNIDPADLRKFDNAEVQREFVRKVGVERICLALKAEVLDKDGDYELLELNFDGEKFKYLKMLNPSIGIWHVEAVRDATTVAEALHERKPPKMQSIPVGADGERWFQQGDVCIWPEGAKSLKPRPERLA